MKTLSKASALVRLGLRTARGEGSGRWPEAIQTLGAFIVVLTVLSSFAAWNVVVARQEREESRRIDDRPAAAAVGAGAGAMMAQREVSIGASELTIVSVGSVVGDIELPPGVDRIPGVGEMVASPEVQASASIEKLGVLPYRLVGTIGDDGLLSPNDLIAYVGVSDLAFDRAGSPHPRFPGFGRPLPSSLFSPALVMFFKALGATILMFGLAGPIRAAVRVSESLQARRLMALRALGMGPIQLRTVFAVRGLILCLVGAGLGAIFFSIVATRLSHVPFTPLSYFRQDIGIAPGFAFLVAIGVALVSACISAFPSRREHGLGSTRPDSWRVWLVPASLLSITLVPFLPRGPNTPGRLPSNVIVWWGAVAAVVIALIFGSASLIRLVGRILGGSNAPAVRLAGRRTSVRAATYSRLFTPVGLLLLTAIVVVPFARATNTSSNDARSLLEQMGRRTVLIETAQMNLTIDGEHVITSALRLATYVKPGDDFIGGAVAVLTCDQLRSLAAHCPSRPAAVPRESQDPSVKVAIRNLAGGLHWIEPPFEPVDLSRHGIDQLQGMTIVTPGMLPQPVVEFERVGHLAFLDTSDDALSELEVQIARQQPTARVDSVIDNQISTTSVLVPASIGIRLAASLIGFFVVLSIGIAVINQGLEAGRFHAPLKKMGSPSAFSTRSYLWEMLPPASVVAVVSITGSVLTIRSMTTVWRVPPPPATTVLSYAGFALLALALTALVGLKFLHTPLQAEMLNNE